MAGDLAPDIAGGDPGLRTLAGLSGHPGELRRGDFRSRDEVVGDDDEIVVLPVTRGYGSEDDRERRARGDRTADVRQRLLR